MGWEHVIGSSSLGSDSITEREIRDGRRDGKRDDVVVFVFGYPAPATWRGEVCDTKRLLYSERAEIYCKEVMRRDAAPCEHLYLSGVP